MKTIFLQLATAIGFAVLMTKSVTAQNTCGNAIPMEPYLFAGQHMDVFFSTVGVPNDNATAQPPFCTTSVGTGGQRWYSMSLDNQIPLSTTIETKESSNGLFDTKLHVYTGYCGSLTCVAGDDDGGLGSYSKVTFIAQPNTTYLIRVGGYNGAEGVTNITLDAGEPGCTDPSAYNYDWTAEWDNGTCCYDGWVVINLNTNGGQPWENTMTLKENGVSLLTIHPGAVDWMCVGESCNLVLEFTDSNGGGWGASTFDLTVNGVHHEIDVPEPPVGSSISTYTLNLCGCKDPIADNYDPNAIWDDNSCCYNSSITLTGSNTEFGYAILYVDNFVHTMVQEINPTANICVAKKCGTYVEMGFTTAGAVCTVILDGVQHTFVSTGTGYQVFQLETDYCGCMDPTAENYNPTAYLDGYNCYYVQNITCENATLMEPNTNWRVDTDNIPEASIDGNCNWLSGDRLLWFKFVYQGGSISLETTPSNHDTMLGLFSECGGNGYCVDDTNSHFENSEYPHMNVNASISYTCEDGLTKGQTYYVAAGLFGSSGEFQLKYEVHDVPGCTDPYALNYSPCSSYDDGSCHYQNNCPADLDGNNVVNVGDLLLFAGQFGSNCGTSEDAN